jgi:hypothetical protein
VVSHEFAVVGVGMVVSVAVIVRVGMIVGMVVGVGGAVIVPVETPHGSILYVD